MTDAFIDATILFNALHVMSTGLHESCLKYYGGMIKSEPA